MAPKKEVLSFIVDDLHERHGILHLGWLYWHGGVWLTRGKLGGAFTARKCGCNGKLVFETHGKE